MNPTAHDEGLAPVTLTHVGRPSKVGYLGFSAAKFGDLWPLLAGVVASIVMLFTVILGEGLKGWPWPLRVCAVVGPVLSGYAYLHFLVEGRPPHFRGDLIATLGALRVDFSDPPLAVFPIIPRLYVRLGAFCEPTTEARRSHPRFRGRRPGSTP